MTIELLIALGLPIAYLVVTTAVLSTRHQQLPQVLQRLTARKALLWNTMVGITIGAAALRWALHRWEQESTNSVMQQLNWGYVQLGLFALAFGALQIWRIGSTLRRQRLPRPLSEGEFRRRLERIWQKQH